MKGSYVRLLGLAALGFGVLAQPALLQANEQSVLLTNEGLILLEDGTPGEALKKFRAAVQADPGDEDARYYLAHSYLVTGMYEDALATLDDREFEYWDADYLRGVAYLNTDARARALTHFQQSASAETANPRAWYYVGLIHYQDGKLDPARTALLKAGKLEQDLEPYRQFYLGLIAQAQGKDETAGKYWDSIATKYEASPAAELAREMMAGGSAAEALESAEAAEEDDADGPFYWDVRVLGQFDSNPGLVQSDTSLARIYHPDLTEATDSLRLALFTDIGFDFGDNEGFGMKLGGGTYAGFHLDNEDAREFNVLNFFGHLAPRYYWPKWGLTFPIRLAGTRLGSSFDLKYNTVLSLGAAYHRQLSKTMLLRTALDMGIQDYPTATDRNGVNIGVPIDLVYRAKQRLRLLAGYTLNRYQTSDDTSPWAFLGHRLHAGLASPPVDWLALFGDVSFYYRGYDNAFVDPVDGRVDRADKELGLLAGLRLLPGDVLDFTFTYEGTFQNSIPAFTYDRSVLSLSVGLSF